MKQPTSYGGHHYVTAALRNTLDALDVKNPHTNKPFSEAMMLGIGGGLGAGYILWEFKHEDSAIIVIGFRNRWNYTVQYMSNLCDRINVGYEIEETAGKKRANENLQNGLASGDPFMIWVDKAHLPYQQLPKSLEGHVSHLVGVYGYDENADALLVDDLGDVLYSVPMDVVESGRARITSDKNRIMRVQPGNDIDVEKAVTAGIQDCVEHLSRDSESFSIPVYEKWSKLMTNKSNKKGWYVAFRERKGLYDTLRSVFEGITLDSTEGAGLREMYAEFLDDAADILGNGGLTDAAGKYREAVTVWKALADMCMTDEIPEFAKTKQLMRERYALMKSGELEKMETVSKELREMQAVYNKDFPMSDAQVDDLFGAMQDQLHKLYLAETDAIETLGKAGV